MGKLGTTEIILILFMLLLLFGGKKIPELMKGLGNGLKEFKNAKEDKPEKTDTKKMKIIMKNNMSDFHNRSALYK